MAQLKGKERSVGHMAGSVIFPQIALGEGASFVMNQVMMQKKVVRDLCDNNSKGLLLLAPMFGCVEGCCSRGGWLRYSPC